MAISRKPAPKPEVATSDVNVDALIAKGGSVPREEIKALKEDVAFTMRVPNDICSILDERRKKPYKTSRQQWVLEAIIQRLDREK